MKHQIKAFDIINIILLATISLICLMPLVHIVAISFSGNSAIVAGNVALLPVGFNLDAYKAVFTNAGMLNAFAVNVILVSIYTIIAMAGTVMCAYPLSRQRFKAKRFFMVIILITMYFSGGVIPEYLLLRSMKLIDNFWVLILPGMISAYNMIILRTFFSKLPASIEEAAFVDGCSDIGILVRIILPLSAPPLATLSLFYAVGRWNGFQDVLFYINKPELHTLQLKLFNMINNTVANDLIAQEGSGNTSKLTAESIKSASVMFATIPILCVYPWLQKYFISGIMLGSVKG